MELSPIYKRVIGLDVHQAQITACAIMEQADGTVVIDERQFGGFKRDRKALAQWVCSIAPELVVMESTGIYWKSPFAALERVGIIAAVVPLSQNSCRVQKLRMIRSKATLYETKNLPCRIQGTSAKQGARKRLQDTARRCRRAQSLAWHAEELA